MMTLYNTSAPALNVTFSNFRFRYNFWTNLSMTISSTQAILEVDGAVTDSYTIAPKLPSS